jgi:surfactin synthase thioesterase subunit
MEMTIGVLSYFLTEATPYAVFGAGGYLAWRFVRAFERRSIPPDQLNALADRVRVLEDVVDQVEDRVERADEIQRFTTRVLAGHVANTGR